MSKNRQPNRINILRKAYPNPFNSNTTIEFSVNNNFENLELIIFDINGRRLETLFSGYIEPGLKLIQWNADRYSSGIYFVVLETKYYIESKKLILVK